MTSKCHKNYFLSSSCVYALAQHSTCGGKNVRIWLHITVLALTIIPCGLPLGQGTRSLYLDADAEDCGLHLPGTFWTLIFLRGLNAERGWCARPHVCRVRRRLAGGIGRQRKPWFPSITIPEFGPRGGADCRLAIADCRVLQ